FDRFEDPVSAPRLDQLERRRHRRLDVGDQALPDHRATSLRQRLERGGPAFERRHPGGYCAGAVPVSSLRSCSSRSLLIFTPARRFASATSWPTSSLPNAGPSGCAIAATRAGSISLGFGRSTSPRAMTIHPRLPGSSSVFTLPCAIEKRSASSGGTG